MAYTARPDAIRKQLDDTAKTSREVFGKAHKEDLEKNVRATMDRYFAARQKQMEQGIKLLENPLPPKDHQERWKKHFGEFGSAQTKILADLVKDDKLIKTPFVNAVKSIASQESGFWAAIAGMPLPSSQGRVLEWYGQFLREQKSLRDDWKKIQGDGRSFSQEMREVLEDVQETWKKVLDRATARARDAEETMRRVFESSKPGDDITEPVLPDEAQAVLVSIRQLLEMLKTLRPDTDALEGRFRSLYKSEEVVSVVLLGGTRSEVKKFLDTVNLDTAVKDFEQAGKKSVEAAQKLAPKGQRDDAEDFVEAMVDEAHETLADFEALFEDFVTEFREVFLGPVGDRTVKDLVGRDLAIRQSDQFQRLNIQSELRKIHDSARDWFALPIGRLHPAVKEALEDLLERDLEALALATREASDLSVSQRMVFIMKTSWDLLFDKVDRLPGASV